MHAQEDAPISAIDWLNTPAPMQPATASPFAFETDTATSIDVNAVTVVPLGGAPSPSIGTTRADGGLDMNIWKDAEAVQINRLLAGLPDQLLPTGQRLLNQLLQTELAAESDVQIARIQHLIKRGALDPALLMIQQKGIKTPSDFKRYFDVSLLAAQPATACALWFKNRNLSKDPATRVYCYARVGEWDTAVMNFFTFDTLGEFPIKQAALLGVFLDPELEDIDDLTPSRPQDMTALEFHLLNATGHTTHTTGLPLGFVVSDLHGSNGWKTRIEAAERLYLAGSLPANQLLGLYLEQDPAASGGVWERVDAAQRLFSALDNQRLTDPVLAKAWAEMSHAKMQHFIVEIASQHINWQGGPAFGKTAGLINALAATPEAAVPTVIANLLEGREQSATDFAKFANAELGQAVLDGLSKPIVATARQSAASLLLAIQQSAAVADADWTAMTRALTLMRQMGLETQARQLAVEALILHGRS